MILHWENSLSTSTSGTQSAPPRTRILPPLEWPTEDLSHGGFRPNRPSVKSHVCTSPDQARPVPAEPQTGPLPV
jgi:hypothetical protein